MTVAKAKSDTALLEGIKKRIAVRGQCSKSCWLTAADTPVLIRTIDFELRRRSGIRKRSQARREALAAGAHCEESELSSAASGGDSEGAQLPPPAAVPDALVADL